jgi:hypothetical protein
MYPYGTITIFTGIILMRSLLFGSSLGLIGGKFIKSMHDKFIINKS